MVITRVVEAKQVRDVIILDILNAFAQANILDKDSEKIIVKIRGLLVDILLEIDKDKHKDFIICYGKEKLLYVKMLKTSHSMLAASILCCKKFRKDIKVMWCIVNSCDVCTASEIANGKQYVLA